MRLTAWVMVLAGLVGAGCAPTECTMERAAGSVGADGICDAHHGDQCMAGLVCYPPSGSNPQHGVCMRLCSSVPQCPSGTMCVRDTTTFQSPTDICIRFCRVNADCPGIERCAAGSNICEAACG